MRKTIKEPQTMIKTIMEKRKKKKKDILKDAKDLGLFKKNKKYKTHDIILSHDEYNKL